MPHNIALACRFALRESRGGFRGMMLMLLALFMGISVITGMIVLRDGLFAGIAADAKVILGGDMSLSRPYRPLQGNEHEVLADLGHISEVAELRTMASASPANSKAADNAEERRKLVEVKAVDVRYPLYGKVKLAPEQKMAEALAMQAGTYGVAVDDVVLAQMGLKVGDVLTIGKLDFTIRAILAKEPDRILYTYQLGPRVLMTKEALEETGLTRPGSLVTYRYRVQLYSHVGLDDAAAAIDKRLPESAFRIRTYENAAPRLEQLLEQLHNYLSMVALAVLVTAGVGIATAVQAWLFARQKVIAVFKCLGAPSRLLLMTYGIAIGAVALVVIAVAMLFGAFLPPLLLPYMAELLPVSPVWQYNVMTFALPLAFGMLTIALFSLWPMVRACSIRPNAIFRALTDEFQPQSLKLMHWVLYALLIAAQVGVAVAITENAILAGAFSGGVIVSFILLYLVARWVQMVAERLQHRCQGGHNMALRYALANLSRVGSAAVPVVLSLGMGTSLLVAVMLIEHNMSRQLDGSAVPADAPAFFFMDIQPEQHAAFVKEIEAVDGAAKPLSYPVVRGRITAIKGVDAEQAEINPRVKWAIAGDRALTFLDDAPDSSPVVAGQWWDKNYSGSPLISVTEDLAEGMGLTIGDMMNFDVLGRTITAKVASVRDVNWRNYRMNFAIIFSPGSLDELPYSYMATAEVRPESEVVVMNVVGESYPSVAIIRLRDALAEAGALVDNISTVVEAVAAFAVLMGVLVMIAAIGATQQRRMFDHAVLKVLGATRGRIIRILSAEFACMGIVAVLAAAWLGGMAAFAMVHFVFNSPFHLSWLTLGITAFSVIVVIALCGLAITWGSLSSRPINILRNE